MYKICNLWSLAPVLWGPIFQINKGRLETQHPKCIQSLLKMDFLQNRIDDLRVPTCSFSYLGQIKGVESRNGILSCICRDCCSISTSFCNCFYGQPISNAKMSIIKPSMKWPTSIESQQPKCVAALMYLHCTLGQKSNFYPKISWIWHCPKKFLTVFYSTSGWLTSRPEPEVTKIKRKITKTNL